jgi:hypothetical protein
MHKCCGAPILVDLIEVVAHQTAEVGVFGKSNRKLPPFYGYS